MLLYLYVISTGGGGYLYPLSVTTTDLLAVRGFTALSAIHKELCHIRYPHGEMAYPLSVLNIRLRCPHGFFIGICHPVSCQKQPISALNIEHSKPDKEIGYIDNESDSSASDSENDPWEDINEEPIDDDDDVMPVIYIFEMLQNSQFIDDGASWTE